MGTAGTTTLALAFGGKQPGITAETEKFDGTSWTNVASLSTARTGLGGVGSEAAGLAFWRGNSRSSNNSNRRMERSSLYN